MTNFLDRIVRALRLDKNLYTEVAADPGATGQAAGVLILANLAAGIPGISMMGVPALLLITAVSLLGWLFWIALVYFVGTRIFPEPGTPKGYVRLFRAVGFACAPGLVRILGVVPLMQSLLFVAAGLWMLIATVVAVRQGLAYKSLGRAIGVCAIVWIVQGLLLALFLQLLGVAPVCPYSV